MMIAEERREEAASDSYADMKFILDEISAVKDFRFSVSGEENECVDIEGVSSFTSP